MGRTLILLMILASQGCCQTAVDLPSFLQMVTDLRNKLMGLLGNIPTTKVDPPVATDIVDDSVFEDQRKEKDTLFDHMKAMSADLGGKEINLDALPEVQKENPEFCSKS